MRTIMAFCRDAAAFHSILAQRELKRSEMLFVSNELEVHDLASGYDDINIIFNRTESFFNVAPHVLTVLSAVNRWLRDQGDNRSLPTELLYWVQHVEGGDNTQRIQDAVIEARSYFRLFDQFHPLKLIIGAASKPYWEDDVLAACAEQRTIPIQKIITFNPKRIAWGIWQRLRPLAKEIYRSIMTIDSLLRRKKSGVGTKNWDRYVAIQLCSDLPKHLNHTLPLLKAFEREGFQAVAVSCDIGRSANVLRRQGYQIAELEAWVTPRKLFQSWYAALKGYRRVKSNISDFLPPGEGGEYASVIRSALASSLSSFFISEVPRRIRFDSACRNFFSQYPPIALRVLTRILDESVIAYRAMVSEGVRPLLFWQPGWPYQMYWPYLRYDVPADYIFCLSSSHQALLRNEGETACQIEVCGVPWSHRIKDFSAQNTPQQSRRALGIASQIKLVVFCDAMQILRGYCASYEQSLLVQAVVNFAEKHPDVCVLIKPHPGHKSGQLEKIFKRRRRGVIWIPPASLPYEGLNAAHVVLTKYSTLAAEAMLLGVPTICVLLDQDKHWCLYDDAVDYALSISELNEKLEALRDPLHYASWSDALRRKQTAYMAQHLPVPEIECNEFIARKIKQALNVKSDINRMLTQEGMMDISKSLEE